MARETQPEYGNALAALATLGWSAPQPQRPAAIGRPHRRQQPGISANSGMLAWQRSQIHTPRSPQPLQVAG
jgi:hypothetical protein